MMMYKEVVLDFETTGLDCDTDEILQVSAIDENGNVLINELCKPNNITEWIESEKVNKITPSMVEDKKSFYNHIDRLSEILTNAEVIIIYNASFEIDFLNKYGVKYNNNIYDLMLYFAEVYGEWSEYYGSYKWQSLETCCLYYGYNLKNAHDSLEDCKGTLYCYHKLITGKENNSSMRYNAKEHIGKRVIDFWNDLGRSEEDKPLELTLINQDNRGSWKYYFDECISSIDDIKIKDLLNCKIEDVKFYDFNTYELLVERCVEAELMLKELEVKKLVEKVDHFNSKLSSIYKEQKKYFDKINKLEKENLKLKEELGLVEKPIIQKVNSYGYFTAEYCRTTGKPMFKTSLEYAPFSNKLLSKSRCKKVKMPVKDDEKIYAFYRVVHGYCALYFRDIKGDSND